MPVTPPPPSCLTLFLGAVSLFHLGARECGQQLIYKDNQNESDTGTVVIRWRRPSWVVTVCVCLSANPSSNVIPLFFKNEH